MGAADGGGACLGKPDCAHLALLHQFRHRADGFLDRHGGIDAVLVIEVDDVRPESLEGGLGDGFRIFRPAVDAFDRLGGGLARVDAETELGGDHHPVSPALQRLTGSFSFS